jgi:NADPH-dependent 2,4-dienoyl-CoA reductase/sulfur reductase-like enzyme
MRIVVIGAVAAGTSAASQAKRRQPEAEVILLERDAEVSYGACGLPYNIADRTREIDDLIVISAERFRSERNIDVRTRHEVLSIDVAKKQLRVRDLHAGRDATLDYDRLIVSTGAQAVRPKLPGLELPGVFTLRTLHDGARVKQHIAEHAPKHALLVGAGYIGMEMAESLRGLGMEVTMLERAPQVLPGFELAIAQLVQSSSRWRSAARG